MIELQVLYNEIKKGGVILDYRTAWLALRSYLDGKVDGNDIDKENERSELDTYLWIQSVMGEIESREKHFTDEKTDLFGLYIGKKGLRYEGVKGEWEVADSFVERNGKVFYVLVNDDLDEHAIVVNMSNSIQYFTDWEVPKKIRENKKTKGVNKNG